MVALARSSTGLLYRSDNSLTGWSGDAEWTSSNDPQYVCHPIPRGLLYPDMSGHAKDLHGVREPEMHVFGGVWWLIYDAGNGDDGWGEFIAKSTDRGLSWQRLGRPYMEFVKVGGGTWPATATGWIEKRGSTYYWNRFVAEGWFNDGLNPGLPNVKYHWDVWKGSTFPPDNTWVPCTTVPTDVGYFHHGGICDYQFILGSTVLNPGDGKYYHFAQGIHDAGGGAFHWNLGVCGPSDNPDGPWTAYSTAIGDETMQGFLPNYVSAENPKTWFSSTLNRWCCVGNIIVATLDHAPGSIIGYCATLTGTYKWRIIQEKTPLDTTGHACGMATHITAEDGLLVEGPNGEVPYLYDTDPDRHPPGWHLGRTIKGAILEPAANCLRLAQAGNTTTYVIARSLSLTDFVMEFAITVTAVHASGITFNLGYRRDNTGANEYRLRMTSAGLALVKVVSSSASTLQTSLGTFTWKQYQVHRIKVVVTGNLHQFYFDGELQVSYTDSSSPVASGTKINLACSGADIDIRNLNIRTSDVLTVTGLRPGTSVWLHSYGELPVDSAIADASGHATITCRHWPHYALCPDGSLYRVSGDALWGGDVLDFTGLPTEAAPDSVAVMARR
jgi:hypothetical protein